MKIYLFRCLAHSPPRPLATSVLSQFKQSVFLPKSQTVKTMNSLYPLLILMFCRSEIIILLNVSPSPVKFVEVSS